MDDELFRILNEELKKQQDKMNQTPLEDFDNLSPEDMFNIVYNTFEKECPIQYKSSIDEAIFDDIPFLNLTEYYLNLILQSKEIKLTQKGNLPTKIVHELYDKGFIKENLIEEGFQKLYKEEDSMTIQNVKIISELAGFTKKRNNKLSLTEKGKKYIDTQKRRDLFQHIFEIYAVKFNLGYHDGYSDEVEVQKSLGFTIYLLLKYGMEERDSGFFSGKIIKAYPHILAVFSDSHYVSGEESFQNCYNHRIMKSFLNWFNLIEIKGENVPGKLFNNYKIKGKLIQNIFEIRNENFKFRKGKFSA